MQKTGKIISSAMARGLGLAVGLGLLGVAPAARAQQFLSDPRLLEGKGIKAGTFELHPGLSAEGGYDSNYFQSSGTGTGVDRNVIDAWRLRITPFFRFQSRGARTADEGGGSAPDLVLQGQLSASYNALWAADSQWDTQVQNQNHIAVDTGLSAQILPAQVVHGDVGVDYVRMIDASNDPDLSNAFRRDVVNALAGIGYRPGGGLLNARLGYGIRATFFELAPYDRLDNLQHNANATVSWRFLPRTVIFYQGVIGWVSYNNTPPTLHNGQSISTSVGVNGLISNHFGALAKVGWGSTFDNRENFDSVIGQAEVTWYPTPQPRLQSGEQPVGISSVSAGYIRSFSTSYLGDFYQRDRGYLTGVYMFGQHWVLALSGGLSHITRPPTYFADGSLQSNGTEENRVDATSFLEYRLGTIGINSTVRYSAELDGVRYNMAPPVAGAATLVDDLSFQRWQVFLGVRWFL